METETRWILFSHFQPETASQSCGIPRRAGPPARINVHISISKENTLTAEVFSERSKRSRKWRWVPRRTFRNNFKLEQLGPCFSHPQWWIIYWPTHQAMPTSHFYLPSLRNTFQNCVAWSTGIAKVKHLRKCTFVLPFRSQKRTRGFQGHWEEKTLYLRVIHTQEVGNGEQTYFLNVVIFWNLSSPPTHSQEEGTSWKRSREQARCRKSSHWEHLTYLPLDTAPLGCSGMGWGKHWLSHQVLRGKVSKQGLASKENLHPSSGHPLWESQKWTSK